MKDRYWILDEEHRPRPVSLLEWGRWLETADRTVARTETELFLVSTVFLGNDHRHMGDGPPLLFETMVFDRQPHTSVSFAGRTLPVHEDYEQNRYSSWDDAEAGHQAAVKRCWKKERAAIAEAARVMGDSDADT